MVKYPNDFPAVYHTSVGVSGDDTHVKIVLESNPNKTNRFEFHKLYLWSVALRLLMYEQPYFLYVTQRSIE